ncbi:MAG: hypothetical protein KY475_19815 [Planctomycetes bacterium]|nr:hypothetical protein [Planctomycetota bacterium]
MDPLISIHIRGHRPEFQPGEELECQYQIDAVDPGEIQALEASVLWHTDGKGDCDLGIHYFERRTPRSVDDDFRQQFTLKTVLPKSPRSYDGEIVKVRWCVRVRLFLKRGKPLFYELPFQLGPLRAPSKSSAEGTNGRCAKTETAPDAAPQPRHG